MDNSTLAPIISSILLVILLGVIAYYVARFLKGRLTLELSSNTVYSSQPLSGSLTVQAKKDIDGLLIVALVGRMRQKKRSTRGRNGSEWVDVFRRETVVEERRAFPAGFMHRYRFTFVAPTSSEVRSGEGMMRRAASQVGGIFGAALNLGASAVGMMQGRIIWHVEARLEADGVDLYAKKSLTVNLRDERPVSV